MRDNLVRLRRMPEKYIFSTRQANYGKNQIKKTKQRMAVEMKSNFEESALTSKYGEKCNSIYAGSN